MKGPGRETTAKAILQEIGEVHAAERGSISLTRLPDEFYERASTYLRTTLAKIENAKSSSDQVVSEEYYRTTEEYRRAKEILTNIYNTRERKIVLMAMNSARKIQQSTENMVHDEMDLFFSLKFELEKIRDRLMKFGQGRPNEPIRGETGINTPITDYKEASEPRSKPEKEKAPSKQSERPPTAPEETPQEDMDEEGQEREETPPGTTLVKALKDITTFMCPDNTSISMKKDDVALLHVGIAQLLIKEGMVEAMEESD